MAKSKVRKNSGGRYFRFPVCLYESIQIAPVPAEEKLAIYNAICKYAITGEEPEITGELLPIFWEMWKLNIDFV